MQIAGFTFLVSEFEGYRFIETIFPDAFDQKRLWAAASSYPTLWDESRPTVTLNDVTNMGDLDGEARRVLKWVLQQNMIRAQLLATSWVTGSNDRARDQIAEVLLDVGRQTDTLFESREEALAYLRRRIREFEAEAR
jgi:hypothetical protein